MKRVFFYLMCVVFIQSFVIVSCAKKKEEECKICRVHATPDQPPVEEEVCSSQEEQDFRSQYSGRTITCN